MTDKTAERYPPHVEEQVEALQSPESSGGQGGIPLNAIQMLMKRLGLGGKDVNQKFTDRRTGHNKNDQGMSDTQEQDPYFPSQNGNTEQYSSTGIDDVSKTSEEYRLPVPERKGKKAKPMATSSLLKNADQVLLSAFFGGVLSGFDKQAWFPDVDPGMLFDSLVGHAQDAHNCSDEELAEVKTAFTASWNESSR